MLGPIVATLLAASWVSATSSLVKVRPGMALPASTTATIRLARGECEAFQVATTAPARAVRASAGALNGPGKHTLPLRLYREGFVKVVTPSNSEGAPGLWPDPLIPAVDAYANEARNAFPFDATAEAPVVVYAELCAPRDAAPGSYRGELRLSSNDHPAQTIAVHASVDPFELPATSSLANAFGLSLYTVAKGHRLDATSPEVHALLDRYARALLAHRVTASGLTFSPPPMHDDPDGPGFDFSEYDREMAPFLEGKVLPSGARFTSALLVDNPKLSDEDRIAYYRAVREHFEKRHWPAALFFYAKDEPREQDFPLVQAQAARVHAARGISVLVTAARNDALAASTDVYCPLLNCFFPRPGPRTCASPMSAKELRARAPNAHVWWYQSCMSHGCNGGPIADAKIERVYSGWASYMVDLPVTRNRAMGPLAFLAGVEGELYYDTVGTYPQDPWQSVWAFGGNGDGTLFYPGTPERIGGKTPVPVESLRLKAIRDGLEDFEYLTLARKLGLSAEADKAVRALARSGYEITADPSVWERTRAELADQIKASWSKKYAGGGSVQP
jgi:hypothetical protein